MEASNSETEFLERLRQKMAKDRFAALVGVEIVEARPGYVKSKMRLEDKHMNAAGVTQGGALFTLADFTFAAATNYGNEVALATDCQLAFLHPSTSGVLWAETEQLGVSHSLASYLVRITDEEGRLIAQFYGRAFKRSR
jgi:acyl-CoA thioesterase